jgi:uncharacterized membrane protein
MISIIHFTGLCQRYSNLVVVLLYLLFFGTLWQRRERRERKKEKEDKEEKIQEKLFK